MNSLIPHVPGDLQPLHFPYNGKPISVPLSQTNVTKGSSARKTDCEESKCNRDERDGIIFNGKPHF